MSDDTAAEELVQETFLSALDGLATFRAEASERTWLFVILRRKIIDHYRRQARAPRIGLDELGDGGATETEFFLAENGHWTGWLLTKALCNLRRRWGPGAPPARRCGA